MITLKTYAGQNINPADDAILYDRIIGASGRVEGCEIAHLGANLLRVSAGSMIVKGRIVTLTDETIYANMSASGTVKGRLLIHIDLSNTEEPISYVTQAAASLPELVQNEDLNYENGVYEIEAATYDVNESAISHLVMTLPDLPNNLKDLTEKTVEASISDIDEIVNYSHDGSEPDEIEEVTEEEIDKIVESLF